MHSARVAKDPIRRLVDLAGLEASSLRTYATIAMLAEAIVPSGSGVLSGATMVAHWILNKRADAGLDVGVLRRVCARLPEDERPRLLRMQAIAVLSPQAFALIMAPITRSMLAAPRCAADDVEYLADALLRFARYQSPALLDKYKSDFGEIARKCRWTRVHSRINTVCLQVVLGQEVRGNVERMLSLCGTASAVDRMADALALPFAGRDHVLRMLMQDHRSRAVLDRMKWIERMARVWEHGYGRRKKQEGESAGRGRE